MVRLATRRRRRYAGQGYFGAPRGPEPRRKVDWTMYGVVVALVAVLTVFSLLGFDWATRALCVLAGGLVVGTFVFGAVKAVRRKWTVLLAVAILGAGWFALAILSVFVPFLGWASPFFESESLLYSFVQGALTTSLTMALIGWLRPEEERKTQSKNQRSHQPWPDAKGSPTKGSIQRSYAPERGLL